MIKTITVVTGKIIAAIMACALGTLLCTVIITIVLAMLGYEMNTRFFEQSDVFTYWAAIAQMVGFMIGTLWIYRLLEKHRSFSLGLQQPQWKARFLEGLYYGFVLISLTVMLIWVAGGVSFRINFWDEGLFVSLLGAIVLFMLGAAAEELFARGYVQGLLKHSIGIHGAIIVSSILFAALHLFNKGVLSNPMPLLNLFLAGLLFGIAREVTQGLWMPIGLHFTWNLFQGNVYGFAVSGMDMHSLLLTRLHGSHWLHGGAFGVEGSFMATLMLIIAMYAVVRIYRKKYAVPML